MQAIIITIILSLPLFGLGQNQQFSAGALREDLSFLKGSIEKFNPALYQYNHKGKFDGLFKEIYHSIDRPLTRLEFFKAVSLLVAGANEGHFVVGSFNNNATKIYRGFFDGTFKYLPLSLAFLGNRAYVTHNFSQENSLQKGWEVLEINDEKITAIVERLFAFIPADGDILTAKYHRLNTSFPALYYWYIDQPASFKLKVLPTGQDSPVTLNIAASNRAPIAGHEGLRYSNDELPKGDISEIYELKITPQIAILKLKTFNGLAVEKYQINSRRLYKSIFRELANNKVENLIIDLRDNGGGKREFAEHIVPYLLKEKENGRLYESVSYLGRLKTYPIPNPSPDAFKGKVYVLINGGSFSNGSVVARFAKEYADATVIGEESASRYEGFATGAYEYIHLPNTLIQIQIPRYWIKYGPQRSQSTSNRGVMPHYRVHYSIEDLLGKKDKGIEKAMELINAR